MVTRERRAPPQPWRGGSSVIKVIPVANLDQFERISERPGADQNY